MARLSELAPFSSDLPEDNGRYLGNPTLVDSLVREFVHDAAMATTEDEFMVAVNRFASIFCGSDANYTPIPNWNTRLELGLVLAERLGVDHSQDWESIMRTALMQAGLEVRGWIAEHANDAEEVWSWKVDALIEFWTSMLLGTVDLTHPKEEEADAE